MEACSVKILKFMQWLGGDAIATEVLRNCSFAQEKFMSLIVNAINYKLLNLADYLKYLLTFPES